MRVLNEGVVIEIVGDPSKFNLAAKALPKEADQIGRGMDSAAKGVDGLAGSILNLKNLIIGGLVAGAFWKLTDALRSCVKEAAAAEDAQHELAAALKSTGSYSAANVAGLIAQADALTKVVKHSDEEIEVMQARMATYGMTALEIKENTMLTLDFAAAMKMDHLSAAALVGKAFAGETGMLSRYGIIIDEATLKARGFAAVQDAIREHAGGQGAAQLETFSGKVWSLGNAWDEAKKAIGRSITESQAFRQALVELADTIDEFAGSGALGDWANWTGIKLYQAAGGMQLVTSLFSEAQIAALKLQRASASIWVELGVLEKSQLSIYDVTIEEIESKIEGQVEMMRRHLETVKRLDEAGGRPGTRAAATPGGMADTTADDLRRAKRETEEWYVTMIKEEAEYYDAMQLLGEQYTYSYVQGIIRRENQEQAAVDDLKRFYESTYTEDLRRFANIWDEKTRIVEQATELIKRIDQQKLDETMSYQERLFGIKTRGMTGAPLAKEEARMARGYEYTGQLSRAQDYYQRIAADETLTATTRKRALAEMERLEAQKRATLETQKADAQATIDKAKADLTDIQARVQDIKDNAASMLNIDTNIPDILEQLDELDVMLQKIYGHEWGLKTAQAHAAGGWALGTDTVPAWLTPGEYVVNARAAAMNSALLQAINSSRQPVALPAHYAHGGPVGYSNHVVVNFYGPGDRDYARNTIMPEIERAMRRGR